MRHLIKVVVLLMAISMVLTACQPAASGTTDSANSTNPTISTDSAAATAETTTVAREKILRVVWNVTMQDMDPLRGGGYGFVRNVSWTVAPPIWADLEGKLYPSVFSEWSSNDDYTVWTFKIDANARFSDGSAITADDVKGTWEVCTQPQTQHQRKDLFFSGIIGYDEAVTGSVTTLSGIVAKDDQTVEVTLKTPDPLFADRIATNLIGPMKISQVRGADGQEIPEWWLPKNNAVWSGPFMWTEMDPDQGTGLMVRNPYWWGETPKLDKIQIVASMEDAAAMILMLKKGEADWSEGADKDESAYDQLGDYFFGTDQPTTPVTQVFWMNKNNKPLDDINCRKALVMAANPAEMFAASFPHGPGEAGTTLLGPVLRDLKTNEPTTNDPEGAKAAFELCQYKDAMPKIYIAGASNPQALAAAQVLADEWRNVLGIDQVELIQQYDKLSASDQAKVQFFRDDQGTRIIDGPTMLMSTIYSKSGNAQNKMGNYFNVDIDRLIEEAAVLPPTDPNRNLKAIEAEKIFQEDYVYIPWYNEGTRSGMMPWVSGIERNNDWQVMRPWDIDIDFAKLDAYLASIK